jgi:hypothetical protein
MSRDSAADDLNVRCRSALYEFIDKGFETLANIVW